VEEKTRVTSLTGAQKSLRERAEVAKEEKERRTRMTRKMTMN